MPESVPSAELLSFLRDHVESYEQLEILLQLRSAREASPELLAETLRLPEHETKTALARLRASGVLVAGTTDLRNYRLNPSVPEFAALADALAVAYERHRLEIIRAMNAHALERVRSSALKAFSDAFVVGRKHRDE